MCLIAYTIIHIYVDRIVWFHYCSSTDNILHEFQMTFQNYDFDSWKDDLKNNFHTSFVANGLLYTHCSPSSWKSYVFRHIPLLISIYILSDQLWPGATILYQFGEGPEHMNDMSVEYKPSRAQVRHSDWNQQIWDQPQRTCLLSCSYAWGQF